MKGWLLGIALFPVFIDRSCRRMMLKKWPNDMQVMSPFLCHRLVFLLEVLVSGTGLVPGLPDTVELLDLSRFAVIF